MKSAKAKANKCSRTEKKLKKQNKELRSELKCETRRPPATRSPDNPFGRNPMPSRKCEFKSSSSGVTLTACFPLADLNVVGTPDNEQPGFLVDNIPYYALGLSPHILSGLLNSGNDTGVLPQSLGFSYLSSAFEKYRVKKLVLLYIPTGTSAVSDTAVAWAYAQDPVYSLVYPKVGVPTISGISQMMDSNVFQAWEPQRWDLTGRLDKSRIYFLSSSSTILSASDAEARQEYFGTLSLLVSSGSQAIQGKAKIWWDVEFEFIDFNPAGFVLPDAMTGKQRSFLFTHMLRKATGAGDDLVVSYTDPKITKPKTGDEPESADSKKSPLKVVTSGKLTQLKLKGGTLRLDED